MKIELNASNEKHRKVGDCFVGCEVDGFELVGCTGNSFWLRNPNYEDDYVDHEDIITAEITLDLSTCQPNIYKCMEHGLRVEVEWVDTDTKQKFDLSDKLTRNNFEFQKDEIKSIKLFQIHQALRS